MTLAFWETGYDIEINDGADLQSQLTAGTPIYAAGQPNRRFLESEGEILCVNEDVCVANDVLLCSGPDG